MYYPVPAALLLIVFITSCDSAPEPSVSAVETPAAAPVEESVKPGINDNFLDPELKVEEWVERFEGESREIFSARARIVDALKIEPGQVVVDVGAGTGPFIGLFAEAVGEEGKVYALDIAPKFVEHLAERAKSEGHSQVEARLCGEKTVDLPKDSADLMFICDVYHHFEYPESTMASIHNALRAEGEVVIVDFKRIPGVTREWVMDHVRAGKAEVFAELDSFGFDMVEELEVSGLTENWVARFRKR